MTSEIIIGVGAEGGSLTLWGRRFQEHSWEFWISIDETAAFELLDEEDQQGLGAAVSVSNRVTSFFEAISLFNTRPWYRLTPVVVHPGFRDEILREVQKKGAQKDVVRWTQFVDQLHNEPLNAFTPQSSESQVVELLDEEDLGPVVKERHIDFLLQEELQVNSEFLHNYVTTAAESFVEHSAIGTATPDFIQAILRPGSRIKFVKILHSVSDVHGESDLIILYKLNESDELIAVLTEDKIHAPFQNLQAQRYKLRGVAGETRQPRRWDHHWTCLVAPKRYIQRGHAFDSAVELEKIKTWIDSPNSARAAFKAGVIGKAIRKAAITGVKVVDPVVTAFRAAHFEAFRDFFGDQLDSISIRPPADDYGDTWFRFKCIQLPMRAYIWHKAERGYVDLSFSGIDAERLKVELGLASLLRPNMKVEQTGKSASIRLSVPPIKDFRCFSEQKALVDAAFEAAQELLSFYTLNRVRVDECLERVVRSEPTS